MNDLIHNYILDIKKKEINPKTRSKLIKSYMVSTGLSQRKLGIKFNIPHSTIQDWLLWDKISKEEINIMVDNGHTITTIYRELRNNKTTNLNIKKSKTDHDIEEAHKLIRKHITKPIVSSETSNLVKDLINNLNRMLMRIEKR